MSALIPSASACHTVQMPPIEKDDRLNLHVRTGSASTLHHSFVFTYGGLTIGLELEDKISIRDIEATFSAKVAANKSRRFSKYLSGEIFFLDLISKVWSRVVIPPNAPKPRPRLFHELATGNNCLYLFGGLTIVDEGEDDDSFELAPCNDLWEFNFIRKSWVLLHDGSNYESDHKVPTPRFSHKLTGISHLSFVGKKDHSGLMIAGGHDEDSRPLYTNCVFDLVDKCYVDCGPPLPFPTVYVNGKRTDYFKTRSGEEHVNINYLHSVIVNFNEEVEHHPKQAHIQAQTPKNTLTNEESLFVYAPTVPLPTDEVLSPLLVAKIGRRIRHPKLALLHRKRNLRSRSVTDNLLRRTVPHNLRYPTGGVFGQNLVIIGFLPNDFDISIFIYNKPTGKWSRLNIFCHHDYGSHRFWGGFVWGSHHKIVLLGNYVTSHTTSSVRYFSSLITVSLPVTNILASAEMALKQELPKTAKTEAEMSSASDADTATSGDDASSSSVSQTSDFEEGAPVRRFSSHSTKSDVHRVPQNAATFSDYVHYAAPKVKFTKVRSVFPPAAITLGRNAFDRYGNIISDFEFVSLNGDRIPVCMSILMARWGKFFIDLLAKAYVKAVDQFEHNQIQVDTYSHTRSSKSSSGSSSVGSQVHKFRFSSNESSLSLASQIEPKDSLPVRGIAMKPSQKEAPQFRLPFQEKHASETSFSKEVGSIDPHNQGPERRNSSSSNLSGSSVLLSQLKEIPAQLPLPHEPVPDVPATPVSFRSNSRKNSTDVMSPRASLLHTLSVLRNISPQSSPKGSISMNSSSSSAEEGIQKDHVMSVSSSVSPRAMSVDFEKSPKVDSEKGFKDSEMANDAWTSESQKSTHSHSLLDFHENDGDSYSMEPSLIPRKLYVPFSTNSLKAFAEYLYTGQVGNKWVFRPVALDCLWMARYFKVQLLYDLLCEVLYGIIGRKEVTVIKEGKKYRRKFDELLEKTSESKSFKFPLDEYEGFLDTVDDGYMDIALLRKSSNVHKSSTSSRSGKRGSSFSLSKVHEMDTSQEAEPKLEPNLDLKEEPNPAHMEKESIDDGTSTSASDEDAPPLHFLDYEKKSSLPSIRYKSVFDKGVYDTNPSCFEDENEKENLAGITLENLVSMDSPEPSDHVIDLIHEVASICADVKLMLRSMNARQMSLALAQTKEDYEMLERRVAEEKEDKETNVERGKEDEKVERFSEKNEQNIPQKGSDNEKPILTAKTSSAGSVTTLKSLLMSSKKDEVPGISENEAKRPGAVGGVSNSKLAPVKETIGSVEQNKKLDKQIAQLIRKDEKLKVKAAKEEKLKKHILERGDKKRSDTLTSGPPLSPTVSTIEKDAISGHRHIADRPRAHTHTSSDLSESHPNTGPEKVRHRFLGRFGRMSKHHKDEKKVHTAPQLARTESSTSVLSAASKKSNNSKKSGTSVGGFLGLRKK